MSSGNQPLPGATTGEASAGQAFLATGQQEIVVFAGPASAGPYVPTVIGAGNLSQLKSTFKNGPTVKEAAIFAESVNARFVFLRLPTATVTGTTSAVTATLNGSSTITHTLSGTATDGGDIVVTFTTGGTTGTAGPFYTVSTNGGTDTSAPIALGTAETIVVLGRSIALGHAKVATAGDTIAWWQTAASSTVLPVTTARVASSTCVVTVTGTPLDAYEVAVEVLNGFTVGVAGGVVRYSLDADAESPTWTTVAIGTAATLDLVDGPLSAEPTGLTLHFAAGTLDTGDAVAFDTTSPTYDSTGLTAGLATLKAWTGAWTWLRLVGPTPLSLWQSADGIVLAWASSGRYSWGIVDGRDRAGDETLMAWAARVNGDLAQYTSTHVAPAVGMARCRCPITGRHNRRSAAIAGYVRRLAALPPHVDAAQFDLGSLPDCTITDAAGTVVEHDARLDPSIQGYGALTLRTYDGYSGVYPTRSALPGADNDMQRIPLRRVMNIGEGVFRKVLQLQICKHFRRWTAEQVQAAGGKVVLGDIYGPDADTIDDMGNSMLSTAIKGMVSSVKFRINRTPESLGGGSYKLTGTLDIVALIYVDQVDGVARFVTVSIPVTVTGTTP